MTRIRRITEPQVSGTRGIDIFSARSLGCQAYRRKNSAEGTSTMTASVKASGAPNREEFSERLLRGSVKKSYEPVVDIDWDAPLDPDKFFLPPKSVSLYGTELWEAM